VRRGVSLLACHAILNILGSGWSASRLLFSRAFSLERSDSSCILALGLPAAVHHEISQLHRFRPS